MRRGTPANTGRRVGEPARQANGWGGGAGRVRRSGLGQVAGGRAVGQAGGRAGGRAGRGGGGFVVEVVQ